MISFFNIKEIVSINKIDTKWGELLVCKIRVAIFSIKYFIIYSKCDYFRVWRYLHVRN